MLAVGDVDTAFGGDGVADFSLGTQLTFDQAATARVQDDGMILVAGTSNGVITLVRYTEDGAIDESFGTSGALFLGTFNDPVIAFQGDRIVIASVVRNPGTFVDIQISRFLANGQPDNSFNGTGKLTTDLGGDDDAPRALLFDNDKIIVVAATIISGSSTLQDFAVLRFNEDGRRNCYH